MTTITGDTRAAIDDALGQPTLCAAFDVTVHAHPDRVAIRLADGSLEWTWSEYRARVKAAVAGLASHGVGPGDAVALLLTNRPEALVADAAAMHLGAIAFSVYNCYRPDQILPLLANSGARVLVTEPAFLQTARATRDVVGGLELIVVGGDGSDHETFADFCARRAPEGFDFEAAWRAIDANTIATIVYTSHRTETPRGVEHTHAGVLHGLRCMDDFRPVSPGGRVVSYLPMAHIAERFVSHYSSIVFGLQITCCPDPTQFSAAVVATRPTRFIGVPWIYEKLAAAVRAAAESNRPLAEALEVAIDETRTRQAGAIVPLVGPRDRALLATLRAQLGLDALEWAVVGAAPTSVETMELCHAIGLDLLEFWGLSECMFSICNPPRCAKFGSLGLPVPGVEIALAADGELLVRGKNVTVGYRHDLEATRATIADDGWMRTGDIARVDEDGYYWLVEGTPPARQADGAP
jgi:long-subunit acyl-CoA synthetase (AMP-forming)